MSLLIRQQMNERQLLADLLDNMSVSITADDHGRLLVAGRRVNVVLGIGETCFIFARAKDGTICALHIDYAYDAPYFRWVVNQRQVKQARAFCERVNAEPIARGVFVVGGES